MTTIGGDYSLESTSEALYCGTQRFLGNVGPLSLEGLLQSFRTIMSTRPSAIWTTHKTPEGSGPAMKEAKIPSSKTQESDAHTNPEFFSLCARAHRPVER